jgi:RNA polymerase sigma-70 factor (ECF subfamily)
LITLSSAGDGAALATLLQAYEGDLLCYAMRRLPQKVRHIQGPEDIVQDTCFEACRLIRGFVSESPGSFYRWLVRIANFRIMAVIQKHRSRRTHALSALAEDGSTLMALEQLVLYRRTPSRSAAAHEFVLEVERSLQQLSDDYRRVIVHRFIDGLSVDETAKRMNRNTNNIYVLCSRALVALRAQLRSASHYG